MAAVLRRDERLPRTMIGPSLFIFTLFLFLKKLNYLWHVGSTVSTHSAENGMMRVMSLSPKDRSGLRTWVEVLESALLHNYNVFRGVIKKDCRLMAVAKSNAYGHDLVQFAKTEAQFGVDWFGVDSITEAAALRGAGIKKPILVLGHTLPERLPEAAQKNIRITLSGADGLAAIKRTGTARQLKVHLKVDTGMHRQGFTLSELPYILREIKKLNKKITIEGLYTHFAAAKNPAFPAETLKQLDEFKKAALIVYSAGFKPICHAAATSGTLLYQESHLDMVRVGIGLYGLWPSKEARAACENKISLKPALSWKTVIGEVKELKRGSRVGYDFTERMQKDSLVAVCPIGYWHGVPRSLSSIGSVLIKGKRAKILGRVSMDMIVVDVSDIQNPRVGEETSIIGRNGKEAITADDMAHLADTVNYEIVTRLNPLMKRLYI